MIRTINKQKQKHKQKVPYHQQNTETKIIGLRGDAAEV